LGAEQHGHMDTVGYDMYCKLLFEAVAELRTAKGIDIGAPILAEAFETLIDLSVSAYLPNSYINNEELKLEVYKKIAGISSREDFGDVFEEMEDRFGDLPQMAVNLLNVALLKASARRAGSTSLIQKGSNIVITFKPDANVDVNKLAAEIKKNRGRLVFTAGANPSLTYRLTKEQTDEKMREEPLYIPEVMEILENIL